jgi:hypothetical protein
MTRVTTQPYTILYAETMGITEKGAFREASLRRRDSVQNIGRVSTLCQYSRRKLIYKILFVFSFHISSHAQVTGFQRCAQVGLGYA